MGNVKFKNLNFFSLTFYFSKINFFFEIRFTPACNIYIIYLIGVFDLGVLGILDAGEGTELLVWEPEFKDTLLLPKPIKIKSNNQTQIYN